MSKWLKQVVALLLLPVCMGAGAALYRLLRAAGAVETVWVLLVAGFACWWVIYLLLPRPMWVYVLGHELTHALWAWLFEGRVRRMKVSSRGGQVVITKNNFVITLAPYFFPLYAVVVFAIGAVVCRCWTWPHCQTGFLLLLGAAYGFHVTLTWHALQAEQTDITSQGYLFSAVVIWLGNVLVLLVGLPTLVGVRIADALRWGGEGTWAVLRGTAEWLGILPR